MPPTPEDAYARKLAVSRVQAAGLSGSNGGPCEDCGAPAVHAHHEDYSKPLEVVYLCAKCHAGRHKAAGTGGGRPRDPNRAEISVLRIYADADERAAVEAEVARRRATGEHPVSITVVVRDLIHKALMADRTSDQA